MWLIFWLLIAMISLVLWPAVPASMRMSDESPFTPREDSIPPEPGVLSGYPAPAETPIFKVDSIA